MAHSETAMTRLRRLRPVFRRTGSTGNLGPRTAHADTNVGTARLETRATSGSTFTVSRLWQKAPRACSVESTGRVLHSSVCHVRARHVADLYELVFGPLQHETFRVRFVAQALQLAASRLFSTLVFSLGGPFGSDCNLDSSATCRVPGGLPVATFCIPTTFASSSQAQGAIRASVAAT